MNFALPFCGCADPPEIRSLSLAFDSCTRETLLDAVLPFSFLIISLGVNSLRRYRTWRTGGLRLTGDADILRLPTTKQAALLRQSLILLVLVLLEISTWAFIFAWRLESAILDRDNPKHVTNQFTLVEGCGTPPYQVLDPILALIPRIYILILVIRSFTTPTDPVAPSKFTLYNPHFLTFYSFALFSAIVRIFAHFGTLLNSGDMASGIEKGFSLVDCFICLAIWLVSATTPSELDQGELLDFDDDDDGVLVLNDGRVVRNGRILSFEATASPLSFMTFGWINSLLHKAYKKPLTADQLWALPLRQRAQENFRQFKQAISTSLVRRIYEANRTTILVQFITANAAVFFHYANPFFLRKLLNYMQDSKDQPSDIGYLYCLAIFVCSMIGTLVASQTLLWGRRWHVSMTNMLNSEIYEHTLQLNHPKENTVSTSEEDMEDALSNKLASLMSRDTERLAELASYLHIFYTCPLEIGVGVIFLYQVLGNSFLAGLVVMAVTLPSTHFISQKLIHVQKQLEEAKTWRTRLLKELFEGIKTTKFLAWEHKWEHVIAAARDDELVKLIKLYTQNTILGLIWFATPVLVTTISFAWYTLIENKTLDARQVNGIHSQHNQILTFILLSNSTAFVSIVLFGMLREPLNVMPQAFMAYNDAKVSLEHINTFLNSGEKRYSDSDSNTPYEAMNYSYTEHVQTGFEEGSFQWQHKPETSARRPYVRDKATLSPTSSDGHPSSFRLTVPEINFPVGSISVITGPRKSGKSSMISALLGEMKGVSGSSHIPSRFLTMRTNLIRDQKYRTLYVFRVAYVAQIPWVESGTIRENILFSDPWDDTRYRAVLYQCDLLRDLSLLENGDLTQIGERGLSLSETQKHKISLARAVYSRAKTVLIDDLFALFETPTVNFLFDKCLSGELMQGRTVIITATELGQWACDAQLLVCLDSGKVSQMERECDAISTWVFTHQARRDSSTAVVASDDRIEALFETDNIYTDDDFFDEASVLRESIACPEDITIEDTKARKYAYATYFAACGGWQFWMSAIIFTVLARVSSISESYWLKEETKTPDDNAINHYVIIYLGLSMVTVAFNFSRTVVQYRGSLQASNRIFLRLLQAVCHAPLQFFDNTLQSEIMNRFGKDMETVDSSIGWHVNFLLQTLFGIIGVVIAIGFILPEVYIASFFGALLYLYIGLIYIRASGELKKLNTDTRPAIVCLYADTLAGLSTIRAYKEQRGMMRKMFQRLDENMRPFYTLWTTNRWLFVRVEVLGALLSLFISVLLVYKRDTIDAGSAGIALTFATSLLEYVYWLMRQSTTVDMHFEAVERINEYLDMPQEPPGVVEGSRPPAAWPATAAINVRDLMVSFGGEEDPILRHVSFNILSGEKVALVGRAGGEKNVLISCIFRFMDPLRGSIKIDGVNIAWIGVKDLRSRITFISKDGWLLSGTVRSNLDPFGEYDDYELWQVLYRAHLAVPPTSEEDVQNYVHSATTSTIYDLDMDLGKDGMALSVGNRQLLCVARALLRDCTRLVVLEEAQLTLETQEKMQRVIEEEFEDSTLLVIPYSLQSVLRYDRAMVFDQGDLVEYDNAVDLLKREDGLLRSLFERAGILDAHLTE
ncbi:ABC transporter type 1, transmembrane domain-containing protein [Phycomyces nitens]|nr:ABC transporter type 1, transmembrane domain-containing protein [Phycomyces nitens]